MTSLDQVTREVERLHDVISGWFRGEIASDRYDPEFAAALHAEFENIQPSGRVLTRDAIVQGIRDGRGTNPDFRISIENPRIRGTWPGLILATYVEFQTGATNSARQNRRLSTVLFETGPRLIWRHLQETGLPE